MKSMTGFGKSIKENEAYQLDIEIKSVNHRYLDLQLRMPRELNVFESAMRQTLKESLQRGRVELFFKLTPKNSGTKEVVIRWDLIDQLIQKLQLGLNERYGQTQISVDGLIQQLITNEEYIEVLEATTEDTLLEELVHETLANAIQSIEKSRIQEGAMIQKVLEKYRHDFLALVEELNQFVTVYEADYRERFENKLNDYLGETVDESRLLTEMALLLERGDIHEELDRLTIHLEKLGELLTQSEPVGRELDFLIQEMNREVNTIGSKSSPIAIKNLVVQMKTVLEKIREQVQNIE
ncbi:YicC family protein [Enterococcus sp. JM4C]|uniref:YicC/YloC family endoribonuclease n=1 Tax=Candidatus Enterococcus huntleyi TaxID=1857217 RepID=UPI00137AD24A|nr:YicC/YloC family endoribonuclease [Enterococcus sp. JM4C]KAF1295233.1 YicC family protein [Enterococcus sp. JM4C]